MNASQLAHTLASNPFLLFSKLTAIHKNNRDCTLLGFDPFLKNHIGTLHAGALFTAAQADAQVQLRQALEQHPSWSIKNYSSQITYKRPAKGPVWVNTTLAELDVSKGTATTVSTLNNENDEPLAELTIHFVLTQGEQ